MQNGPGKYPQWTAVLPTSTEYQLTGGQIGLSPKLIGRAAQIMEAGPWIVTFRDANRAAIVQYWNEENGTAQGLIMPIMLHDMEFKEKERQNLNAKLAQAYEKAQERKHAAEAMPE
jgi:transposase